MGRHRQPQKEGPGGSQESQSRDEVSPFPPRLWLSASPGAVKLLGALGPAWAVSGLLGKVPQTHSQPPLSL